MLCVVEMDCFSHIASSCQVRRGLKRHCVKNEFTDFPQSPPDRKQQQTPPLFRVLILSEPPDDKAQIASYAVTFPSSLQKNGYGLD